MLISFPYYKARFICTLKLYAFLGRASGLNAKKKKVLVNGICLQGGQCLNLSPRVTAPEHVLVQGREGELCQPYSTSTLAAGPGE